MKFKFNIPNLLSLFRIVAFPVLVLLLVFQNKDIFKWLLAFCFFTDLIDGYIARKFKQTSAIGSKLDSVGDMLTLLCALAGFAVFEWTFVREHLFFISLSFGLYFFQLIICLIKYKQVSNFHTYSAKIAFIFTGSFFLITLLFQIIPLFFWIAISLAILECLEEIIIVFLLPKPEQNVKSVFHVLKKRKTR